VCACFAVLSAALCRVPVSTECMLWSGFIRTLEYSILVVSGDIITAPSILHSSKSFCEVKRQLILNPPSMIPFSFSSGELNTIIPPKFDLTRSSITVLRGLPGETNFMKSRNDFSFSVAINKVERTSIYNFAGKSVLSLYSLLNLWISMF
jgi:hypothetical protein